MTTETLTRPTDPTSVGQRAELAALIANTGRLLVELQAADAAFGEADAALDEAHRDVNTPSVEKLRLQDAVAAAGRRQQAARTAHARAVSAVGWKRRGVLQGLRREMEAQYINCAQAAVVALADWLVLAQSLGDSGQYPTPRTFLPALTVQLRDRAPGTLVDAEVLAQEMMLAQRRLDGRVNAYLAEGDAA